MGGGQIASFETVRQLVLDGLEDHWGTLDLSLNPDLESAESLAGGGETVVIERGGEVVATGTVRPHDDGIALVVRVAVARSARRQGLGRAVVDQLVGIARGWGSTALVLECNASWEDSKSFWGSCGFRRTHVEPAAFGPEQWFRLDLGHWFEPIADHLGATYLRYSFTKGTDQEVAFLVDRLGLGPSTRVLDAGCGPGRHLQQLRALGIPAVGLDISEPFCRLAGPGAVRADIRRVPFGPVFDVVYSLCQGGFGLLGGPGMPVDDDVNAFQALAACLRPGGHLLLSAFSSYFQVKYQHGEGGTFDPDAGVMHERTEVKDAAGIGVDVDLWTTGFTARELRLMVAAAGLDLVGVHGTEPGAFGTGPPTLDSPELLLIARRPG